MNWSEKQGPIEKNIPLRPPHGRPTKYQWRKMEIGDSFLVRCEKWERQLLWGSLSSCKKFAVIKTGFKFSLRVEDGPVSGIRVWRTE
jgi:hypothetical protein